METKVERVVFLKGQKTILRPPNKETDLKKCLKWINDPEVNQYLQLFLPTSQVGEEAWFDKLYKDEHDISFAIETLKGELIGFMGLHRINWKDRVATTGAFIGEKEYRGKGFGSDAKMALLNYAFNGLDLRKICSTVIAFNKRSVAYSLRCGYKIEGRLKRHIYKKGRYYDQIMLAVFKEKWLPLWRQYKRTGRLK